MTLTQEELNKFCQYLEQNIESVKLLLPQLKPRGLGATTALASQMRVEMAAEEIVLKKLQSFKRG